MITPSALNLLVIGFSMLIFSFFWRMLAARYSDRPLGMAMASIL
jgi:hypothetical protein